jgi:hypothetical protein
VPLAPGELYYGYGQFGPWSMNVTSITVNTVVVNRTYVNARHGHAVTVVDRDSFGTGIRVPVKDAGNPFVDKKHHRERDVVVAPPPDRPKRPIVLVPPGTVDHAREHPPARVRERRELPETKHGSPPARSVIRTDQERQAPPAVQPVPERQPPDRVRANRPDTLKQQRRLVKEQDASVFRQQRPESMPVKQSKEPKSIDRKPPTHQGNKKEKKDREEKREGR